MDGGASNVRPQVHPAPNSSTDGGLNADGAGDCDSFQAAANVQTLPPMTWPRTVPVMALLLPLALIDYCCYYSNY